MDTVEERFWSKVDKRGPADCWNWTAHRCRGYGMFRLNGKMRRAPRVSWEWDRDLPIADGLVICHTCDNPACVNPAHLFLATREWNNADRDTKDRQARGERMNCGKLTAGDVSLMRLAYETLPVSTRDIAEAWGVGNTTAFKALKRETWKHVRD